MSIELLDILTTQIPDAVPGTLVERILGRQGNTLAMFPTAGPGLPIFHKATGKITAAEILGGVGALIASSPSAVVYTILTHWQLGFTYPTASPYREFMFAVQRRGLGSLSVIPAVYRGAVASQAAMLALVGCASGDWCSRTDLGNQRFVLTGTSAATLGDWSAVTLGAANQPAADLGSVASEAAQVALNATLGDVCTRSDQANQKYRLTTLPASSFANWTMIDIADGPKVIINNVNNVDVATLPARHQPVVYQQTGHDMWDMY